MSKKEIQLARSLKSSHGRKKNNAFLVEAIKNVEELLMSNLAVQKVYLSEHLQKDKADNFKNICLQKEIQFQYISKIDFNKITTLKNPEGVIAICSAVDSEAHNLESIEYPAIFLSEVNDPGNLGTICRTAVWFGIQTIMLSINSVDPYNPKVVRGSMGNIFHLNIIQNIEESDFVLEMAKQRTPIYAADLEGENPVSFTPRAKYVIYFGSESHGVSEKIIDNSHALLSIPKFGNGESLNLGVSVGIILNSLINKG